jgi:hypothetical protein
VDQTGNCTRTLLDMRMVQTAIEAYAIDHGSYPAARSMEELRAAIQPTYIRTTPITDAWGNELRYILSSDSKSYRLVSAGSDRAFDEKSWSVPGLLDSSREDAVFSGLGAGEEREWVIQE